jgi:hypothetical protein
MYNVKVKFLCLSMYGGMEVKVHIFITLALGSEWSASHSGHFIPEYRTL